MQASGLPLRDIHQPPPPPWWPPAPGWWLLASVVLLLLCVAVWWFWRRRRSRQQWAALFDATVDAAETPGAQVAAMSGLLRRAARRRDPQAERLQGTAWLDFLDAESDRGRRHRRSRRAVAAGTAFSESAGRLLLDGGYRDDVDPAAVAALRPLARRRFLQWMGAS